MSYTLIDCNKRSTSSNKNLERKHDPLGIRPLSLHKSSKGAERCKAYPGEDRSCSTDSEHLASNNFLTRLTEKKKKKKTKVLNFPIKEEYRREESEDDAALQAGSSAHVRMLRRRGISHGLQRATCDFTSGNTA